MKIAYYIGSFDAIGGMERVISLKANWLAANGYDVHIISFVGGDKPFYPLDERIKVHAMNCIPFTDNLIKSYLRKTYSAKCKLKTIMYQECFDIFIMAFPFLESFIASLHDGSKKIYEAHCAKEFNKLQIIRSTYNPNLQKIRMISQRKKEYFIYNKFDKFVALTARDLESRSMPKNGIVIPNPNTFEISEVSTLNYKRIITVGRYSPEKGYEYLLQAWKNVERKYPEWQLDFYGADSGYKQQLEELKKTLGLKKAFLHGSTSLIKQQYLTSSIFVMSSINEGFPMVLTEAMACGVPCIAFDCVTGPAEIITHGQDGLLIHTVGDYQTLGEYLCHLIEDEGLRKSMGRKARANVVRFSMESVMHRWISLFNELHS